MVKLLSVQAHNFKKLRLDSPIQFHDGITLIAGLNESGKSSLLDAILYALFGRVTRPPRARTEDLVSYGASEATVLLDFEIADRKFRVKRLLHRVKPTRASLDELTAKGQVQPLATGQEKVSEEIVRLLGGITYHEIVSSTVVAQKELNKLIELNKDDRRKVINAFLNLESFNTVLTSLGDERKDLEGTGTRIGRVQSETEKLRLLKQELAQFNQNGEEKTTLLEQNASLAEATEGLQSKFQEKDLLCKSLASYENILRTKQTLALELDGKKRLHADHQSRGERLRKEVEGIEQELSKFADYDRVEPSSQKIQAQSDTAKARSLDVKAAERSRLAVEQEIREAERKLPTVDYVKLRKRAEQLQKPILPYMLASAAFLVGAVAAFVLGSLMAAVALIVVGVIPAFVTLSRLNATTSLARHQSILGSLRYLDEKRQESVGAEERYKQAKIHYGSAAEELTRMCETLQGYSDIFRSHRNLGVLEAAQMTLEAASKDKKTKEALQVKLQTVRDEIGKLPSQATLTDLGKEIRDLERRISEQVFPVLPEGIVFTPELLSATLAARDQLGREIAATQSRIEQNMQRIRDLDKYLAEHAEIVTKVQLQEDTMRKFERQLKVVKRAVEGIQATAESLRNRIRPGVQGYMSAILPALTSSRYRAAILDEDYNLQVWDPEAGEYRPKEVYSGGTEDQFLLAMRLAFALALLPEVKGQKPEFVFLDEPLGSSDDVRRSGILDYLTLDLSKKFKQIFIISHVGGLEDHVRNVITLDDGRVTRAESV